MGTQRIKYFTSNLILLFWRTISSFIGYYVFAVAALIILNSIQSEIPFYTRDIAENILGKGISFPVSELVLVALGIITFRTLSRFLFFYPARIVQKELRTEIFSLLESVHPSRYNSFSDGQLFQLIIEDCDALRTVIGFSFLQITNMIIALSILIPKFLSLHPKLLWALTPMLVAFSIFIILVSKQRHMFRKMQDVQGDIQNVIAETFQGRLTIKSYGVENQFVGKFVSLVKKDMGMFFKVGIAMSFSMPMMGLGQGLSLLWGAWIIRSLDLGIPTLVAYVGFLFLFLEPLMFLSWIGLLMTRASASWKRLQVFRRSLFRDSEEEVQTYYHVSQTQKSVIANVPFWREYVDVELTPGEWTTFVGKTGCGKSFLLKHSCAALKNSGKNVVFVEQHPYLFNDTVEKNIFLGKIPTPEDLVLCKKLLRLFKLSHLAYNTDELLQMEVGEHGKRLSGGEGKRVALIRSLFSNAEYLFWDDPFSSVDLIQEREIVQELKALNILEGKNVIQTSHRYTTVKLSHSYCLLEKDRGIQEMGESKRINDRTSAIYELFEKQMV